MLRNVLARLRASLPNWRSILRMSETTASQPVVEKPVDDSTNTTTNDNSKKSKKFKYDKEERKRMLKIRRQAKKEVKQVGFFNESLTQTDYYFENGLRKVYPYFFFWNTTAKERWFGRTVYDVYKNEFGRAIVNQNLDKLIETGKIKVNNKIVSKDFKIKNGDRVSHAKHRHEIPVLGDPIKIIHDDENFLVVDKPCSIPMHPCGKYRFNTLSIILAKEYGYANLRTMYRLDRLTSGCVILGKNFKSSLIIDKHIKDRTAKKTYICRVVGKFPDGKILVDQPLDCASHKIGMYWVDEKKGKESLTEFERVSYNGKSSVVLCYPKTGRTHQIRIHLQYLGYPIVNDPLYNQPTVWGKDNGKGGVYEFSKEEIEQNFLKVHTYEAWIIKQEQINAETEENTNNQEEATEVKLDETKDEEEIKENEDSASKRKIEQVECDGLLSKSEDDETQSKKPKNDETAQENIPTTIKEETNGKRPCFNPDLVTRDDECFECQQVYRDPNRSDLTMYLHALSYKCGDLEFKTDLPKWADENFDESN